MFLLPAKGEQRTFPIERIDTVGKGFTLDTKAAFALPLPHSLWSTSPAVNNWSLLCGESTVHIYHFKRKMSFFSRALSVLWHIKQSECRRLSSLATGSKFPGLWKVCYFDLSIETLLFLLQRRCIVWGFKGAQKENPHFPWQNACCALHVEDWQIWTDRFTLLSLLVTQHGF